MRIFALLLFITCSYTNIFCQSNYWQQQVNYTIDVSLNDVENTLTGFEKLEYINNSPDTLKFIYIHLWPNAYKNDRTAFSEQLLKNDRTDFYFSDEEKRGYINQLDFKVNKTTAITEETNNIDVIKLVLPEPLAPQQSTVVTTPFHVKLPYDFSRGGYIDQSYQCTQWYSKVAMYDKDGWHAMPYLDQGEFYSDFGNYTVNITLPDNYKVAATGVLQKKEASEIKAPAPVVRTEIKKNKKPFFPQKPKKETTIASSKKQSTWVFAAENVTDFAWFADKNFIVKKDTIQLASHTVQAACYVLPESAELYANCMRNIKRAVRFYSNELGEYPYPTVNVVCSPKSGPKGGMEYPMITIVNEQTEKDLDETTAHEIGHNWLMGILSTNERDHPWMDEGMNTYFENKYMQTWYANGDNKKSTIHLPNPEDGLLATITSLHKDQPIETTSEKFNYINYDEIVYEKTGNWMEKLERTVGEDTMKQIMHTYFKSYAFKHPQPADFKQIAEKTSGKDLSLIFGQLYTTGFTDSTNINKKTKLKFTLPAFDNKYHYVTISPIAGYNNYDKVMIGAIIHNYQLPLQKFQFLVAPMYATGSSRVTGAARFSYNHFTKRHWLEASVSGTSYSINDFTKDDGSKLYFGLTRFVPSLKLTLYNKDLREKDKWIFQLRSFILNEEQLDFKFAVPTDTVETAYKRSQSSVINQLKVSYENNRILYPYNANITIDQGKDFLRFAFTGNYFFDYNEKHEGINARVFAGKYFKLNSKNSFSTYYTDLNMSGPKGDEDYTYSGYFIGRNEFEGWQSQQIMERDGFFKVRTDLLGNKVGKTDDWLIAVNLSGDIPEKINPLNVLPFKLPIKFFLDIGTYSEAWKDDESNGKFLYDAGLQVSLFRSLVNVYFPLVYSKVYSDYFKTYLDDNRFLKTVSFNINLNAFQLNKLSRDIPW